MSISMTPVVLVCLPNLPYLLGTFDTARFRNWWRSKPFPDELQEIKKGFHIYGRTHLVLAQRKDGRWAVYRSKNYGIDWERVFLAAAGESIYDIVLITFGRAILNTSRGFYETVNAGSAWTLVLGLPSAPNAPAFCNIGGGDVLVCTDGRYIWRSTDIARHWAQVCDMHTIDHFPYSNPFHYTGPSKPTIAGACGRVMAANGPYLVRSEDGGVHWHQVLGWEYGGSAYSPPYLVITQRLINPPKFLVSQISVSSIDGPVGDDVVFLVKIDDIVPVYGESELFSWLFVSYSAYEYGEYYKNNFFKPVFRQHLVPSDGLHLDSYEVSVAGANYIDRLVFSAQTKTDPVTGKPIPSLKYSTDGGLTWTDVDLTKIKIGDPTEGENYGGSMMDDNFAKITWIGPPCCNHGHYDFIELKRRQCQSYEMDMVMDDHGEKSYNLDGRIECNPSIEYSLDFLVGGKTDIPYDVDGLVEGSKSKPYRLDRTLEGISIKDQQIDAILSQDIPVDDLLDAHIWANSKHFYKLSIYSESKLSSFYQLDTFLSRQRLNERLSGMERKFPQVMDIDVPGVPYGPYDSRREDDQ